MLKNHLQSCQHKHNYQFWNVKIFSVDSELMQLPGHYIAAVWQKLPSPLCLRGLGYTFSKGTISKSWWETAITLGGQSLPWGDRRVRYKSHFPCKKILPFCFTLSKTYLLFRQIFLFWKCQFPQNTLREDFHPASPGWKFSPGEPVCVRTTVFLSGNHCNNPTIQRVTESSRWKRLTR